YLVLGILPKGFHLLGNQLIDFDKFMVCFGYQSFIGCTSVVLGSFTLYLSEETACVQITTLWSWFSPSPLLLVLGTKQITRHLYTTDVYILDCDYFIH
ncbi:hypothetical protein STEG23_016391, partial [Scotinomys teguina]